MDNDRTTLKDQSVDSQVWNIALDGRTARPASPMFIALVVKAYPCEPDRQEMLYQAALDNPDVCAALDNLYDKLARVWPNDDILSPM